MDYSREIEAGFAVQHSDRSAAEEVLDDSFIEVRKLIRANTSAACFVICLKPGTWQGRFLSLELLTSESESHGAKLSQFAEQYAKEVTRTSKLTHVDVTECASKLFQSDHSQCVLKTSQLQPAAAHVLKRRNPDLGWLPDTPENKGIKTSWRRCTNVSPFTLRWFQETLDLAHHYDFDIALWKGNKSPEAAKVFTIPIASEGSPNYVLAANQYMQRDGIVTTLHFPVFVAEYLYSLVLHPGATQSELPKAGELNQYFIPVRGMGQWRACVCWTSCLSEDLGFVTKALIDQCSLVFDDEFAEQFRLRLSSLLIDPNRRNPKNVTDQVQELFAALWWADEIQFFKGHIHVNYILRHDLRSDRNARSLSINSAENGVERQDASHITFQRFADDSLDMCRIEVDLVKLCGNHDVAHLLGFDRVVYHCRLIDRSSDLLEIFDRALAKQLTDVIRSYSIARVRQSAEVMEMYAHNLKNAISLTNWEAAIERLQALPDDLPESVRKTIDSARQSLSRFVFVEGNAILTRLIGICQRGEYGQLTSWTNIRELNDWYAAEKRKDTFSRYVGILTEFIRLVATAGGLLGRIRVEACELDGEIRDLSVDPEPDRISNPVSWIEQYQNLRPFTWDGALTSSHLALMAILIEPVHNAVKFLMREKRRNEAGALRVIFVDSLPDGVELYIGNKVLDLKFLNGNAFSSGMHLTAIAMAESFLGEFVPTDAPPAWSCPQANWYWIKCLLRPQLLCERIVASQSESL